MFFYLTTVSLTESSLNEFKETTWSMVLCLSMRWTRSETLVQKSRLSKNAEDLLKVVTVDQPVAAASESQVMDKLHAFFVTLEYLNICDFSIVHRPLKYLELLEEWRHEHRGLALLLTVDSLIRKKVAKLMSDHRKTYTTFSKARLEVLDNHTMPVQVLSWKSSNRQASRPHLARHQEGRKGSDRLLISLYTQEDSSSQEEQSSQGTSQGDRSQG